MAASSSDKSTHEKGEHPIKILERKEDQKNARDIIPREADRQWELGAVK